MKKYIGIEIIEAKPMTRGDYNELRCWIIPEDENPNNEGYLIRNSDTGYISWRTKEEFEKTYQELTKKNHIIHIEGKPREDVPKVRS